METRRLGQTSLVVSRLGLGLASLGRPGYINIGHANDLRHDYDAAAMETHCHAVLDAAWKLGVRYLDAARSYGKAEEFQARWLARSGIRPEDVTVGSKWGYTYTADWQVEATHHEIKIMGCPGFSNKRKPAMAWRHLDLYQIHWRRSAVCSNRPSSMSLGDGGLCMA